MDSADVVVIGAGVTGLSTSFWLAKAGVDVLVVDKGIVGWEASGRNGGSSSPRGDDLPVLPLATEANRLWPTMDEELGYPTEWVGKGRVAIALDEERMAALRASAARWEALDIPIRVLDARGVRDFVPCVSPSVVGGTYSWRAGHANPQRTVQAFAWATLDRGGRIYPQTAVSRIVVANGRVAGVDTARGRIATELVISCAGPQTARFGQMVGVELPLAPARVEIIATVPLPPLFEVSLGGNGLYGRQTRRGNLIFGGGPHEWVEEVGLTDEPAKPSTPLLRSIARRLAELMPSAAGTPILRSWAGVVEEAPDYFPIIERLETPAGLILATASAHGFGLCPATGKAISELATKGASSIPIEGLRLGRFAGLDSAWRQGRQWVAGAYNT
jgi:glycine/D-amino acid oxidase-like deaminating enzyme